MSFPFPTTVEEFAVWLASAFVELEKLPKEVSDDLP